MKTVLDFTLENAHRIWDGDHLKSSQAKIVRFTNFGDFKTRALGNFKPGDIYGFLDHLQDQGCSDSTINRYTAAISSVMKLAVDNEEITHAPKVRWKKVKTSGRPRFFNDKEIDSILAFYRGSKWPWMADLFILGIETGMRKGEILAIENIDSKTYGQRSADGRFILLTNTKNGHDRNVPLVTAAQEALERLDNCPMRYFRHKAFYDALSACKDELFRNDPHFCFHITRHTCATNLVNKKKASTLGVAMLLGHSSLATTQKYVHEDKESMMAMLAEQQA
jgi:integrase